MPMIHIRAIDADLHEDGDMWTDFLSRQGASRDINRQCAIGWHADCSDPEGVHCTCHCHPQSEWPGKWSRA